MDKMNLGYMNMKPLVDNLIQQMDDVADKAQGQAQEAGEAIGRGFDDGINYTVERIKASSIKTDKAFKNLSEKIRKQVQQLSTNIGGKDTKIKIDFSDVDINSDAIKQKVSKLIKDFSTEGLIEFDAKGSEQQFKNLITLYVKYQEKLNSLKQVNPGLSNSNDILNNLQQQLALSTQLREIWRFLDRASPLDFSLIGVKQLSAQVETMQKVVSQTKDIKPQSFGEYDELAKVLNEIQSSLKVISDTFKNENNSMKSMAENGVTSFTSLSQAIIEVYNNLTQVQSLVDTISQKDFNVTNITQTGGGNSNIQAMTQQMAVARETMEHLRQLYDQAGETLTLLSQGGQIGLVFEYSKQLQELDMTNINKSIKGANTEMKLASVVAEMQDYIDKLKQINELRNKYNLGEWKDTFVPTQKSVSKPVVQPKSQTTETPTVTQPQEIISSVEADKLREFVNIINNEIGVALDNIKVKFAQSFVVPELDKNNLQTSFDEIYNKFVELKDKIGTMKIDVGVDTANITMAIKEALYAEDIAKNYKQVEFEDIYEPQFDKGTWTNKWTGEIFNEFEEVDDDFEAAFKDLFMSKEGYFLGTKEEMFTDLLSKQNINSAPEQNDWAQVIVEAINTQGNNIVEAIKIVLPKNISDGIYDTDSTINESELSDALKTLSNAISIWNEDTGRFPGSFFQSLLDKNPPESVMTPEVTKALNTLGLLSSSGEPNFVMPTTGIRNLGVAISDKTVLNTQMSDVISDIDKLKIKLDEAYQLGASVPRILAIQQSTIDEDGAVFQLQSRVPGENINANEASKDFLSASSEQIDRLIHTFETLSKVGLFPDFMGDNVMFDQQKGFSLVDLDTMPLGGVRDTDDMVNAFLKKVFQVSKVSSDEFNGFSQKVKGRFALPSEKRLVNVDTVATEQVVGKNKGTAQSTNVKLTPTMDDGAIAKLVDENVAKTPATVKVIPIVDSATNSEQAVNGESQSAIDAAKTFVDAANAKKQFVEANKQVAEGAKESAKAVEEEVKAAKKAKDTMVATADNTELLTDWDKEIRLQEDHNEDPFALQRTKTANVGDESVRTIVETWSLVKDEDGELTGEMALNTVKIINDFKKRTDAITKETEKIKTAQAYLQKFLTQFNNKTMGKGSLLTGYKDLEILANNPNFKIDDIAKAEQMMSNLDAEYNKVVQSMRKGSSSMNPFVNAINGMDKMEDVLRGISLQFKTLNQQPEWLKNQIIDLYKQLDSVSAESDIYKFAEGFGNLKVSINSVVETIRQQRVEQKLTLSDFNALVKATKNRDTNTEKAAKEENGSAWETYYLDRASEQQKVIDTIRIGLTLTEAQETQLNAMAEKHALILSDITRENNKIEEQKQKYEEIMRLLEQHRADQIELDNDTSLNDADRSVYQQILNEERAKIEALIANTDLNPGQAKTVNKSVKSIEDDRIAKVKKYIDLLKLQYDYEKRAIKEDDGSDMQSFYNEQVAKVKERIQKIDIQNLANQEEKNKLLALEEEKQRDIAEILQKKNNKGMDQKLFIPQEKKIQEKFDAGYLNDDLYNNWQKELVEYRNYMSDVTKVDEATIQNKKQSLIQMYDMLVKTSNASKSFFASGGEILPEMAVDPSKITNVSATLEGLFQQIKTERFENMKTSMTGVNEKLGQLNFTVNDGKGHLSQYAIKLNETTGAVKLLSNTTKPALTVFEKFGQTLKKDFTGLLHAVIGGTGIYAFVRYIRQGIEAVRELDLALTELKKVTDETEEIYDSFLDTASKTSARIGKTVTEMTSATAEFAKLGYDIKQASSMAESALVYANVGDNVDVETGSQSIISTLKAFGIEANNTMSIVDKFNEVGNNFAITTKGIGDALQVSASAMAAAGNSLDETIALTTAANTIVQNPNTVGTALKTLSLRIRGVKTE